jgi:8-oxo-dGTP diphosphatase
MYQPILGTLGYVLSPDKKNVLLVNRNRRPDDPHYGKYNGLGGKMMASEDIVQGMKREIFEEAGIMCHSIRLRGTVNWPGFGPNGQHWLGFVFLIEAYGGEPYQCNEEGDLVWAPLHKIHTLPMWEGDKYFLPLVFDQNPEVFHALIPYEQGKPVSFSYTRA